MQEVSVGVTHCINFYFIFSHIFDALPLSTSPNIYYMLHIMYYMLCDLYYILFINNINFINTYRCTQIFYFFLDFIGN